MVIDDSNGGGADVTSTIGGASGVVRGAEDVASGMSIVEGVVGADAIPLLFLRLLCQY